MTKHFWRSDLTVFRNTTNYISIRSCSPRVKGTEFTNNENKKGHYISDGSTIIMRTGDEYKDIFPIWDWNRLPGITAPLFDPVKAHKKSDDYKNPNAFVGGLTNGKNGISTFHLARNEVFARKSWFYINGILICLGTDIKSKVGTQIITDVNQCLLKGNTEICFTNSKTLNSSDTIVDSSTINSVWHDSIGYFFPESLPLTLTLKTQTGNWHEIDDPYSKEQVSGKVFNLWINHGENALTTNLYEYVVIPSITPEKLKIFTKNPSFDILANNKDIQAVKLKTNKLFQLVFHKQGKFQFNSGEFIEAKTPGLIQLEQNAENSMLLTVSEPTQTKKVFRISLTGKYSSNYSTFNPAKNQTEISIPLPQGGYAGKCVSIKLKK